MSKYLETTSDINLPFKSRRANNRLLPIPWPVWGPLTGRKLPTLCSWVPACSPWRFSPGVSVRHWGRSTQPEASGWGLLFLFCLPWESVGFFNLIFYIIQNESPALIEPPDKCGWCALTDTLFPPDAHHQPVRCRVTRSSCWSNFREIQLKVWWCRCQRVIHLDWTHTYL